MTDKKKPQARTYIVIFLTTDGEIVVTTPMTEEEADAYAAKRWPEWAELGPERTTKPYPYRAILCHDSDSD